MITICGIYITLAIITVCWIYFGAVNIDDQEAAQ